MDETDVTVETEDGQDVLASRIWNVAPGDDTKIEALALALAERVKTDEDARDYFEVLYNKHSDPGRLSGVLSGGEHEHEGA